MKLLSILLITLAMLSTSATCSDPPPLTDKQLDSWAVIYNHRYFNDRLPLIKVRWAFLNEKYGETIKQADGSFFIRLDVKTNREEIMARINLLHELAHASTMGKEFDMHGPLWQAERHRLMMEGAFDDLI